MKVVKIVLAIVAAIGLTVLGFVLGRRTSQPSKEDQVAAKRLHEHCNTVRTALQVDEKMLSGDDPKDRELAASQFANLVTFHSVQEIDMCSSTPPDLRDRDICWLRHDYRCLARLASLASRSVDM